MQNHPKASPFRKKGFPLFDELGDLIDGTRAMGEFAFRVGNNSGPSHTRHSSPPTPPQDDYVPIDPRLLEDSLGMISDWLGSPSGVSGATRIPTLENPYPCRRIGVFSGRDTD